MIEAPPSVFQPTTVYSVYEPPKGVSVPELELLLRKKNRKFRHASRFDVIEALSAGVLERYPLRLAARGRNKIQDGWLLQTVGSHLFDALPGVTPTDADFDGSVRRLAVGQNYTSPTRTDAGLLREVFRAEPQAWKQLGDHHKFTVLIDFDEANGAETTVNDTDATTTVIPVASTTGMYAGSAVRIQLGSQFAYSTILSVGSGEIILVTAEALPSAPANGAQVLVCIGEAGIFGNVGCDDTANSGTCFSRARLHYPKTNAYAPALVGDMILVPA